MKSCLKSPPSTPGGSMPCTPCSSGGASPGSANVHLPCLRKTVSFCEKDDGLEEFFQADDWDRTPAPVAPKLSYECVSSESVIFARSVFPCSDDLVCGLEPSHVCAAGPSHTAHCAQKGNMCASGAGPACAHEQRSSSERTKYTHRAPSLPYASATVLSASSRTAVRVLWSAG